MFVILFLTVLSVVSFAAGWVSRANHGTRIPRVQPVLSPRDWLNHAKDLARDIDYLKGKNGWGEYTKEIRALEAAHKDALFQAHAG